MTTIANKGRIRLVAFILFMILFMPLMCDLYNSYFMWFVYWGWFDDDILLILVAIDSYQQFNSISV